MTGRLAIVGVLGSGTERHAGKADPLGRWLAALRVHLLTGGGRGVMESVSRAFHETRPRQGRVIGVLPGDPETGSPRPGYPNDWVEIPIVTHLPLSGDRGTDPMSRNHINVLTPDVLVALPGGLGTSSEVRLAVGYARPVVAFVDRSDDIPDLHTSVAVCQTLEDVKRFLTPVLANRKAALAERSSIRDESEQGPL